MRSKHHGLSLAATIHHDLCRSSFSSILKQELGLDDSFTGDTTTEHADDVLHPQINSFVRDNGVNPPVDTVAGPSIDRSGYHAQSIGQKRTGSGSTSKLTSPTSEGSHETHIAKKTRLDPKGKAAAKRALRLGCPMVKIDRDRYMAVHGPCTDLMGINPTLKALNEHLKKQHCRDFRCMTCWKWHKSPQDLNAHRVPKKGHSKCDDCCRVFKRKADFDRHCEEAACRVDEMDKPGLFTEEQEETFKKKMKNKGQGKGADIDEKYAWVLSELFPDHEGRDRIWPYYDFAVFTHKVAADIDADNTPLLDDHDRLREIAGGLRRGRSPATSPSNDDDPLLPASSAMNMTPTHFQAPFLGFGSHQAPYLTQNVGFMPTTPSSMPYPTAQNMLIAPDHNNSTTTPMRRPSVARQARPGLRRHSDQVSTTTIGSLRPPTLISQPTTIGQVSQPATPVNQLNRQMNPGPFPQATFTNTGGYLDPSAQHFYPQQTPMHIGPSIIGQEAQQLPEADASFSFEHYQEFTAGPDDYSAATQEVEDYWQKHAASMNMSGSTAANLDNGGDEVSQNPQWAQQP